MSRSSSTSSAVTPQIPYAGAYRESPLRTETAAHTVTNDVKFTPAQTTSGRVQGHLAVNLAAKASNRWNRQALCSVGTSRSKHTMRAHVTDESSSLYVFGGDDGSKMLNDLLRFDTRSATWSVVDTVGVPPSPRYHHSAVVHGDSMFIFGGYSGDLLANTNLENRSDLIEYRFATKTWVHWASEANPESIPAPRSAHGSVVYKGYLYILCGYDGKMRLNDMWRMRLDTDTARQHNSQGQPIARWSRVEQRENSPPTCCNFPVAVADDSLYLFSGHSGSKTSNDIFRFHFPTESWSRLAVRTSLQGASLSPPRRFGHTMAHSAGSLYVFGGSADNTLPNDLYAFHLHSSTWEVVQPHPDGPRPRGRCFHACDMIDDVLYIFGGTISFYHMMKSSELFSFTFTPIPQPTLSRDLERALSNGIAFDVEFVLPLANARVSAHRSIVAARSPALSRHICAALDRQQETKTCPLEVVLDTISDLRAFRTAIHFMYTDELDQEARPTRTATTLSLNNSNSATMTTSPGPPRRHLPADSSISSFSPASTPSTPPAPTPTDLSAVDQSCVQLEFISVVCALAKDLEMSALERRCEQWVVTSISEDNIVRVLQAVSRLALDHLKGFCLSFAVQGAVYRAIIQQPEFQLLDKALIVELVREQQDPSRETQWIAALGEWTSTLAADLGAFLISDVGVRLADFTLTCNGEKLSVHKPILIARSEYYAGFFRSNMSDSRQNSCEITIGDVVPSPRAARALVEYLYTDTVRVGPADAVYLFVAHDYLAFPNARLQVLCKQSLEEDTSHVCILQIFEAAHCVHAHDLKQHALDMIMDNFLMCAPMEQLQLLKKELLLEILQALTQRMGTCSCGILSPATPSSAAATSSRSLSFLLEKPV